MRSNSIALAPVLFLLGFAVVAGEAQGNNPPSGLISTIAGNGVSGYTGNGDAATSARLWYPYGMTLDASGNLYVAEAGNGVIRKVGANGKMNLFAGLPDMAGYAGDGGAATLAQLNSPTAVALDAAGNLYIADSGNNVIRKIQPGAEPDGGYALLIFTVAGNGIPGYSGDGHAATSAQLKQPSGIAVDAAGDLFIADTGNNVIRKVTPGGIISTIAGDGTAGYFGDSGAAIDAQLNAPFGIALDGIGNLYIADTKNNAVRRVTSGGSISTVAGTGTQGFSGDGESATDAQLNNPTSVGLDAAGDLYIADTGNQRIREVTLGKIYSVAGDGTAGYAGDGAAAIGAELNSPSSVAVDSSGDVYIADTLNNALREVFFGTRPVAAEPEISLLGGSYSSAQSVTLTDTTPNAVVHYSTDGSTPTPTSLVASSPIYVGGEETIKAIAVATGYWNSPVAVAAYEVNLPAVPTPTISPAGGNFNGAVTVTLIDAVPGATIHYTIDGSAPVSASPVYIVPVTLTGPAVLRAMATAGGYRKGGTAVAQFNVVPYEPTPVISPPGASIQFLNNLPNGQLTITDADPTAAIFYTVDGSIPNANSTPYTGPFLPPGLAAENVPEVTVNAIAIAPGKTPSLVASQTYNQGNALIFPFAGNGGTGYSGDGGPAVAATLNGPTSIVFDAAGNLYVSDTWNNVVRKITPAGIITTYAGGGTSLNENCPATSSSLNYPNGLAVDTQGDLYIADTGNNRIRKVTPEGIISSVAGNGNGPSSVGYAIQINGDGYVPTTNGPTFAYGAITPGGYSGDGVPATSASLAQPMGVAVDAAGNLYIADTLNQRIRKVNTQGIISTVAGNGDGNVYHDFEGDNYTVTPTQVPWPYYGGGYSGDGGPATTAELNNPESVAVDASGNLYIADTYNNSVRMVNTSGTITTIAGSGFVSGGWGYAGGGTADWGPSDPSPADGSQLWQPAALALDSFGNLWVTDTWDERVKAIISGGITTTCIGNGSYGGQYGNNTEPPFFGGYPHAMGYYSDGQLGDTGCDRYGPGFAQPMGVAVDPSGNVYIADNFNNMIREVTPGLPQ